LAALAQENRFAHEGDRLTCVVTPARATAAGFSADTHALQVVIEVS
jgi:hypothetical protein